MDYATLDDLIARFGETELIALTDTENNAVIQPARIERALGDAQAVVDGLVGRVYRLPLRGCAKPQTAPGAPIVYAPPPQLTRITCDIARYYLHDDLAPEHEVYRRHKSSMAELEAIASGDAVLACPWGGLAGELVASDAQEGVEVQYRFSPRSMTDESLEGYA